ncbi:MAG: pyrroline-5-carboxylate reductase [Candidatus Omnitrophica bacterium]|nr:pyrroline-5-carboxylate reductase [Candidatus Omnitrophota bacterium]MBD3269842.1 pyrroline-5-carboxylate reductase [Candidatus Omnitrophota bacterium]
MEKVTLGIIGFGNMGEAIGRALNPSDFKKILVYDLDPKKLKKDRRFTKAKNSGDIINRSEVILLAIKPQNLSDFLKENKAALSFRKPLIVSILAGISTSIFEKYLKGGRIIRAMPNLPALVGEGFTFLSAGRDARRGDLEIVKRIFSKTGEVVVTEEKNMDRVTSITGSGPGYVFYFMDALYRSALNLGFPKLQARRIAIRVFLGSAKLAEASGKDFASLLKGVASPKGTTEAALKIFESQRVGYAIEKGVKGAKRRSEEISRGFKER